MEEKRLTGYTHRLSSNKPYRPILFHGKSKSGFTRQSCVSYSLILDAHHERQRTGYTRIISRKSKPEFTWQSVLSSVCFRYGTASLGKGTGKQEECTRRFRYETASLETGTGKQEECIRCFALHLKILRFSPIRDVHE